MIFYDSNYSYGNRGLFSSRVLLSLGTANVQAKVIIVQDYHVGIGGEEEAPRPICVEQAWR
jgi:hypothetical protein